MRSCLLCLLLLFCTLSCLAQRVTLDFNDTSLAEALRQIDHVQQDKHIIFVFNDLEDLHISYNVHRKDAADAVREVCQGLPILITESEDNIFIEYIKPPMHLLPSVSISGRQIQNYESGFTARPNIQGLSALDLLTSQPNITLRDGHLYMNGQPIKHIYLNGMPLTDQSEVDQLTSDVITQVKADYSTGSLYITLRRPSDRGYYGFAHAEFHYPNRFFESAATGVINARYNKTSIYDKFRIHNVERDDDIRFTNKTPNRYTEINYQMNSLNRVIDNRISVMHEFSDRHSLGFSHYIASHLGESSAIYPKITGVKDFNGQSHHLDNEVTLKYMADLTQRHIRLDLLGDVFTRKSYNENISLYGAGVGTEQGEAPTISMMKVSADIQHPIHQHLTLKYGADFNQFSHHYVPTEYLSNVNGLNPFLNEMNIQGKMSRLYLQMSGDWHGIKIDAGLAPQLHHSQQSVMDDYALTISELGIRNHQQSINPFLRLFIPLGSKHLHTMSLSLQQELDEIPYAILPPTIRWNDAFNYSEGNRYLQAPQVTSAMIHLSLWQSRLLLTASYRTIKDEIYWQTEQNKEQDNLFKTKPIGISRGRHLGLQAECNIHPSSAWQMKFNAQMNINMEDETLGYVRYKGNHLQQYYACINHFYFPLQWSAMLSGILQPKFHTYDRTYRTTYHIRAEVMKSFCNNRYQVSVMAQPFQRNRGLLRVYEDYTVNYSYEKDLQTFGFRFIWNFRGHTRVKVKALEGTLKYNNIIDN